ncbi:hypothetical protein VTI74DRAFT_11699 [Chaetomium olivicolor]
MPPTVSISLLPKTVDEGRSGNNPASCTQPNLSPSNTAGSVNPPHYHYQKCSSSMYLILRRHPRHFSRVSWKATVPFQTGLEGMAGGSAAECDLCPCCPPLQVGLHSLRVCHEGVPSRRRTSTPMKTVRG